MRALPVRTEAFVLLWKPAIPVSVWKDFRDPTVNFTDSIAPRAPAKITENAEPSTLDTSVTAQQVRHFFFRVDHMEY